MILVLSILGLCSVSFILGIMFKEKQNKKYAIIINTDVKITEKEDSVFIEIPIKNREFSFNNRGTTFLNNEKLEKGRIDFKLE